MSSRLNPIPSEEGIVERIRKLVCVCGLVGMRRRCIEQRRYVACIVLSGRWSDAVQFSSGNGFVSSRPVSYCRGGRIGRRTYVCVSKVLFTAPVQFERSRRNKKSYNI